MSDEAKQTPFQTNVETLLDEAWGKDKSLPGSVSRGTVANSYEDTSVLSISSQFSKVDLQALGRTMTRINASRGEIIFDRSTAMSAPDVPEDHKMQRITSSPLQSMDIDMIARISHACGQREDYRANLDRWRAVEEERTRNAQIVLAAKSFLRGSSSSSSKPAKQRPRKSVAVYGSSSVIRPSSLHSSRASLDQAMANFNQFRHILLSGGVNHLPPHRQQQWTKLVAGKASATTSVAPNEFQAAIPVAAEDGL